jgi:hypothetical protein
MFQQTSCHLKGVLAENCKNFLHPRIFPFPNSPSQIFQLFHPFKGYYLSYVFTSSCILISTQVRVHRCAGISCILSHPLPFKKYVRLAHGRYSHVIVSSSLSTNMSASTTTWPLRPLSAWPTAATATERWIQRRAVVNTLMNLWVSRRAGICWPAELLSAFLLRMASCLTYCKQT